MDAGNIANALVWRNSVQLVLLRWIDTASTSRKTLLLHVVEPYLSLSLLLKIPFLFCVALEKYEQRHRVHAGLPPICSSRSLPTATFLTDLTPDTRQLTW